MKVLYAEDEPQLSVAVAEMLRISGYEVDAVSDGLQAWQRLQSGNYQAVVLDIMMPGMDGIQVLQKMRAHQDYTPVLLLTARSQVEDRVNGLSVGADDYLSKPFHEQEFLARLSSILRRAEIYSEAILSGGNFSLNCRTGELTSSITTLRLSSSEVSLLSFLMKKPGVRFTLQELRENVFSDTTDDTGVELYLSYLIYKMKQLQAQAAIVLSDGSCTYQEVRF